MRVTIDIDERNAFNIDKGLKVVKAKIKLSQVTRDAKLTIRFLAPILISDLVKNIKNESIKIKLLNEEEK